MSFAEIPTRSYKPGSTDYRLIAPDDHYFPETSHLTVDQLLTVLSDMNDFLENGSGYATSIIKTLAGKLRDLDLLVKDQAELIEQLKSESLWLRECAESMEAKLDMATLQEYGVFPVGKF